ncbi:MAG: glutamate-5-semialdehyde dehydrogenase [Spirochaetaceae bacterium]
MMESQERTSAPSLEERARRARESSRGLAGLSGDAKNRALEAIAGALWTHRERIVAANREDLDRADRDGVAAPLVKRLRFDERKLAEVIDGIHKTVALQDPVGAIRSARELDEGLRLYQESCPLGVLGIIFESRPDALVQISTLSLKSGNAVLLKGGSEAAATNRILAEVIGEATRALEPAVPEGWIQLLETRQEVADMLKLDVYIDLIIPRGSNAFVRHIMDNTRIPVLGHADGVCHLYVDEGADPAMATRVVLDSKTQYVAVCNAVETVLVHEAAAASALPRIADALEKAGVEVRGCERTLELLGDRVIPAADEDWATEYLDMIVAVRIVPDVDAAIAHINTFGSHHTDAIVSPSRERADRFMSLVDSASVMWNASTRFADGYRYGLGAEVGISTSKIHARGPVGLEGLVTYKWRLEGDGHVVADYVGENARPFAHRPLPSQRDGA